MPLLSRADFFQQQNIHVGIFDGICPNCGMRSFAISDTMTPSAIYNSMFCPQKLYFHLSHIADVPCNKSAMATSHISTCNPCFFLWPMYDMGTHCTLSR